MFTGPIITSASMTSLGNAFDGANVFWDYQGKPAIFTDTSGVNFLSSFFRNATTNLYPGINITGTPGALATAGGLGVLASIGPGVRMEDCAFENVTLNYLLGLQGTSNFVIHWGIRFKGIVECVRFSNNISTNMETVAPNIFSEVTEWRSNPLPKFGPAKLDQTSVDNVINSVDAMVASGGDVATGVTKTLTINGGTNAAPSPEVVAGAIARLTAAGWTILTN
jgi:hypothetical protein